MPTALEETAPRFEHYPADDIPSADNDGVSLTVIAGEAYGLQSPVQTSSETLYVEAVLEPGATLETPRGVEEVAVYPIDDVIDVDGYPIPGGQMAVLEKGTSAKIRAGEGARVMMLGGATLPGERIIWWNFVSSSRERLAKAKQDWLEQRFDDVPGDDEFIPLPNK